MANYIPHSDRTAPPFAGMRDHHLVIRVPGFIRPLAFCRDRYSNVVELA